MVFLAAKLSISMHCAIKSAVVFVFLIVFFSANAGAQSAAANNELYRSDPPEAILKAARALIEKDENTALVTVDENGQPRVRSVRAFLAKPDPVDPFKGFTVWIMTRDSTRKVGQIRRNPKVTLYFNDDEKVSYLSIMGTAAVVTDPSDPGVKEFLAIEGYKEFFWPEFPKGFVMIRVRPTWLEFMGPDIKNHRQNWRPQAVEFPKT